MECVISALLCTSCSCSYKILFKDSSRCCLADYKDVEGVTERILSEMDDFIQTGKLPWLENEKRPVRSIASCKKLS